MPFSQPSPRKGAGFAGFPPDPSGGEIGKIVYAKAAPNSNYLPADGSVISAASYPAYARVFGQVKSFPAKKLTDGTPHPALATSDPAISPLGAYGAVTYEPTSVSRVTLYTTSGAALAVLTTRNLAGVVRSGKSVAFTDGDRHLVALSDATPFLEAFARTAGTDTFSAFATTWASPIPSAGPIAITADDVIIMPAAGSPFLVMATIVGSTLVTKSTGWTAPHAAPTKIVRTKSGDRFAMIFATSPFVRVYDYAGGVFTEIATPPNPGAACSDIDISPLGDYITTIDASNGCLAWKAATATSYPLANRRPIQLPASGSPARARFTQDGVYLGLSSGACNIAGGAFVEAHRGAFPGFSTTARMSVAQNSDFLMLSDTSSPYFHVYMSDPTVLELTLPAFPSQGAVPNILNAYVRVK